MALVRGQPTPVIHLARLLTQAENTAFQRYVLLRTVPRPVALAVGAVLGVEDLPGNFLQDLPPLLQNTSPEILAGIGAADQHLLLILRETRLLTPELEALFAAREAGR
jgi:purine-binding chemotaxis protein CheW